MKTWVFLAGVWLAGVLPVQAQRGGDGGLIVKSVIAYNVMLVPYGNELRSPDRQIVMQLSHQLLDESGKPKGPFLPRYDLERYDVPYTRACIYIPGMYKSGFARRAEANHRLIFSIGTDTMILDVMGVVEPNMAGYFDEMRRIYFTPGHYVLYLKPELAPEFEWTNRYGAEGTELVHAIREGFGWASDEVLFSKGIYKQLKGPDRQVTAMAAPPKADTWPAAEKLVTTNEGANISYTRVFPYAMGTPYLLLVNDVLNLKGPVPMQTNAQGQMLYLQYSEVVAAHPPAATNVWLQWEKALKTGFFWVNDEPFTGILHLEWLEHEAPGVTDISRHQYVIQFIEGKQVFIELMREIDH